MSFNLDNYVDVPTRLRMALEKHPDLRIQESQPVFREVGSKLYIEIRCTVWRDKDDTLRDAPKHIVGDMAIDWAS